MTDADSAPQSILLAEELFHFIQTSPKELLDIKKKSAANFELAIKEIIDFAEALDLKFSNESHKNKVTISDTIVNNAYNKISKKFTFVILGVIIEFNVECHGGFYTINGTDQEGTILDAVYIKNEIMKILHRNDKTV